MDLKTPEQAFAGRPVLITGGLGTIGSTLARRLARAGARVTLADCLVPESGGLPFNIAGAEAAVEVVRAELGDTERMRPRVAGQEVIFNLAGLGCHSDSMRDPLTDLAMNVHGHVTLLELCRETNPGAIVVYAGTRQIYGKPDRLPVDESHPLRPVDVNGINKLAAEQYHLLYHKVYGLRACVLRLTNVLGPRMRVKDSRQVFFGAWFRLLLEGRPFEVWGGEQVRDLLYVEDAADAFLAAALNRAADGRVFNVGSAEPVTLKELADRMVSLHGAGEYRVRPFPEDRRRIDIGDYVSDIGAIRSALGWQPRTPLDEAIRRTLDYYKEHLPRYV